MALFGGKDDREKTEPDSARGGDVAGGVVSIEHQELGTDRIVRELHVPTNLAGIEGHFAGFPVVPGIMQIGWSLDAAEVLLGEPPRVRRLDAVKFPSLLRPGTSVRSSRPVASTDVTA